jgi:RimJ/RimL family protein N-acetyltransferase
MHPPIILTNDSLPRLFCKPIDEATSKLLIPTSPLDLTTPANDATFLSDGALPAMSANHDSASVDTSTSFHGTCDDVHGIKSASLTDYRSSGEISHENRESLCDDQDYLYCVFSKDLSGKICFRGMDLETDLTTIHKWVNMSYTAKFWQMDGSFEELSAVYQKIQDHPNAHSFVGFYEDRLVCQLDVYMLGVDELGLHIPDESRHCGFHLLMAPNETRIPGLTIALLRAFLDYYFSFPEAEKMYAEPDVRNIKSQVLLRKLHFSYLRSMELSYKWAMLFCLGREEWVEEQGKGSMSP